MKGGKSKAGPGKTEKLAIRKQKVKRVKDPNKPKRPPSAFLLFMEVFRQDYRKLHPDNKRVGVVGKAAGDKWRSMTEEEKAPYIGKAEEKKVDYEKEMTAYLGKSDGVDGDSDKSKSEVNNEEEGNGEEEENDD